MRYFVDESPKDEVSLATEIQFLENYIALEKIRIRHEIELDFIKNCNSELRIPPMLLMTFVENIFLSMGSINQAVKTKSRFAGTAGWLPAVQTQNRLAMINPAQMSPMDLA